MKAFRALGALLCAAALMSPMAALAQPIPDAAYTVTTGQHRQTEPVAIITTDTSTGLPCQAGSSPTCPLGGGSSSATPWTKDAGAAASLSVTTSTAAATALPGTGTTIWLINNGNAAASCLPGGISVQAATTDNPIQPGGNIQLARNTSGYMSCIAVAGSTTITVLTGSGNPNPAINPDFSQTSIVKGDTATGATFPANPFGEACRAATSAPTAVSDGQLVAALCGIEGKRVTLPYAIKELQVRGAASGTDGSAHSIIASAGGSLKNYVTDLECYNTSATTITMTFSDAASSVFIVPAGAGFMKTFNVPLATAAATAFSFTASTGVTTAGCAAQGFTGL